MQLIFIRTFIIEVGERTAFKRAKPLSYIKVAEFSIGNKYFQNEQENHKK